MKRAVPVPLRLVLLLPLLLLTCACQESAPSTLHVDIAEPYTIDPSLAVDLLSQVLADALFLRLTDVHEETNEVLPALATHWGVDLRPAR